MRMILGLSRLPGLLSREAYVGLFFAHRGPRCQVNDHGACPATVNSYLVLYTDPIGDPVRVLACYYHAREYVRRKGCTSG